MKNISCGIIKNLDVFYQLCYSPRNNVKKFTFMLYIPLFKNETFLNYNNLCKKQPKIYCIRLHSTISRSNNNNIFLNDDTSYLITNVSEYIQILAGTEKVL